MQLIVLQGRVSSELSLNSYVNYAPCFGRYLILPNFIPKDEVAALLSRAKELIAEFSLEGHPMVRVLRLINL